MSRSRPLDAGRRPCVYDETKPVITCFSDAIELRKFANVSAALPALYPGSLGRFGPRSYNLATIHSYAGRRRPMDAWSQEWRLAQVHEWQQRNASDSRPR